MDGMSLWNTFIVYRKENNMDTNLGTAIPGDPQHVEPQYKLPIVELRQAVMKLESAMLDIYEAKEEVVEDENKYALEGCAEIIGQVQAVIVNMIAEEMGEEEFLALEIEMEKIEQYPGTENAENIMDEEID